jgi:hypothetical protein
MAGPPEGRVSWRGAVLARAAEQLVGQQLAMLRLRPVHEAVQAVLPKTGLAPRREWLAGRTGSRAIRRDDALHSRIARPDGVDRIDRASDRCA